jgi:pimeloyl-ACP methyl ester carboxylesterase
MTKHTFFKNTKITYSDNGQGQTVVLLHGFLENSTMWNYLAPVLAKKNRVICIDLLGHGQSECLGYVHTMEDMAAAAHFVLSELKIEKAVFVGHSMGGYVALAFAELYPVMMQGLVLLNSTARADSAERVANRTRAIKAVKQNYIAAVRMSISNLFSEENREKLTEKIEWVRNEALQTPLQGIIAAQEGMKLRKSREDLLKKAHYPILLILGKKDPVLNYEENKTQIESTNVQLVSFEDGHMSHLENQLELEECLVKFLEGIN